MDPVFECPDCGYQGTLDDFNEVEETDDYWEFEGDWYDQDDWSDWVREDPSLERLSD